MEPALLGTIQLNIAVARMLFPMQTERMTAFVLKLGSSGPENDEWQSPRLDERKLPYR
jgi:hypothetical protein